MSSKPETSKILYVHWAKLLGRMGYQTDAQSRQGGCNWTWMKLPTRYLFRISLALTWGQTEGLIGTWGPTSIQRVTRHKNTLISSRCQNTTYSPAKADPPGTQCTKSPWWSSHLTCSYLLTVLGSSYWPVMWKTFLLLVFVVTECQMVELNCYPC